MGRGIKFCRFSIFYGAVRYLILDRTGLPSLSTLVHPRSENHALQCERVCGCIASLIVIKTNINSFEFRRPSFDLAGPGTQSFFAVASPVLADLATVKADLREIRSDVERRMISGELADAECGIELFQDGIDLGIHPRKLAKLEGTAHAPRQNSQQLFQPLRIDAPMRRKLE